MTLMPSHIIPCIYTVVFTPLLLLISPSLLLLLYHRPSPPPSLSQLPLPPLSPFSSGLLSSILGFNDNYQKPSENKKGGLSHLDSKVLSLLPDYLKRRSIGVLRVHNLCKGGGNLEVPRFDYNQFLHCFSNKEGVMMFEEVGRRLKEVGIVDLGDVFSMYWERMATRDRRMRAKFSSGCFQDNGGDSLINMENTHIIYPEKFHNSAVIDTEHFQA